MGNMFIYYIKLKYINFGNIKISKVHDMSGIFYKCNSLTSIDLSEFDTSKVQSMDYISMDVIPYFL